MTWLDSSPSLPSSAPAGLPSMASNLLDYAKRVAVRRIVYVLVALVLGFVGIGRAEAQGRGNTPGPILCTNKLTTTCTSKDQAIQVASAAPTALSVCIAYGNNSAGGYDDWTAQYLNHTTNNEGTPDESIWANYRDVAPNGFPVACGGREFFWKPKDCATQPDILEQRSFKNVALAGKMCEDGCEYQASGCSAVVVDGFEYTTCSGWKVTGQTCGAPTPTENAPADGDGDGSSDGNDPAPNNPGEGGGGKEGQPGKDGSQGEGSEGSGPGGKQGNGPGEGSGNGNTAGGGGDCGSPPSVQGDAALAMVAYQGWRTACAVEAGNKAAAERAGTGTGTGTGGNGTGGDQGSVGFDRGDDGGDDGGDEPGEVPSHTFDVESMLDFSGFAGGGSCPDFGSITLGPFGTHSLGGDYFCEWLPLIRALIILSAVATAIKILLGYNA